MNGTLFFKKLICLLGVWSIFWIGSAGWAADRVIQMDDASLTVVLKGDVSYQFTLNGMSGELPQRHVLKLRYREFDPLKVQPQGMIPDILRIHQVDAQEKQAYIVQFHTQAFAAYQEKLTLLGADVLFPLPYHAYIVHMDAAALSKVKTLDFVRWVGYYEPAYKLDKALHPAVAQSAAARRYNVMLVDNNARMKQELANFVRSIGGTVDALLESSRMEVNVTGSQLRQIAAHKEVLAIDLWTEKEEDMDQIRDEQGANYLERVAGYTGQGVNAEVCDSGLMTTHSDFQRYKPTIHASNGSSTFHGTNCYGIVFGDGTGDPKARGILTGAEKPIFAGYDSFADRLIHTQELVNPAGPYRAVFQTNSWGDARTLEYTTISAEMDEILLKTDLLITQSQSNARGAQDSRPQAWAKNIVAVGGIVGYDTPDKTDDSLIDRNKGYGASVGPASDGRIKPDLSNYYGYIYTTTNNGGYNQFGGTSGATPATAGNFGLLFQMWGDGVFAGRPGQKRDVFAVRPHAATAKALMIHSAWQYPFQGASHDLTRVHQGWGFPDVKNLYELAKSNNWRLPILIDENKVLLPAQTHAYNMNCTGAQPLKATMVYADPAGNPGASLHRVNDLTLKVTSPAGVVYWGNNGLLEGNWSTSGGAANIIDNVENVFIQNPSAGIWRIEVIGSEIIQDSHLETAAIDADYALVVSGGSSGSPTPIRGEEAPMSDDFILHANYPNPFNPLTNIRYTLKQAGEVTLVVYDLTGQKVTTLVNQRQTAGPYTVQWNALDTAGQQLASGIYMYRLSVKAGGKMFTRTHKMVLLK